MSFPKTIVYPLVTLSVLAATFLPALGTGKTAKAKETFSGNTTIEKAVSEKRWAVCGLSDNFMREEPEYEAELGNQMLMGTLGKVLGFKGSWIHVESPDPYRAWVGPRGLVLMTDSEKDAYLRADKYIFTGWYGRISEAPSANSAAVGDLVAGDIILKGSGRARKGFLPVVTPDGRSGYVPRAELSDFSEWCKKEPSADKIVSTAMRMMGVPYLWGGNTVKGVDCSGMTRLAYFLNGVLLPRNASQQALVGLDIPVGKINDEADFSALKPGDLLFFAGGANPQKVTHVGMYIGGGRFIHSSGMVRISSLDPEAGDYYGSKSLVKARRMLGEEAEGVVMVRDSEYYNNN